MASDESVLCLVSAVTGEVGTGSNMSGKATNQDLTIALTKAPRQWSNICGRECFSWKIGGQRH